MKAYGQQNVTRRHYATLPGSTASYGHTQTYKYENYANLLASNWLLYTPENSFQSATKCQGGPFLGFAQVFSAIIAHVNYATTSMGGHIDNPPMLK